MKYTNEGKHAKNYKLKNGFVTVQPGEVVDLPENVGNADEELVLVKKPKDVEKESVSEDKEDEVFKTKKELEELSKDALNDYAAKNDLGEVKPSWNKAKSVKAILKYIKSYGKNK